MDSKYNRLSGADSFGKSDYKASFQNNNILSDEEYIRQMEEEERVKAEAKRIEEQRIKDEYERLEAEKERLKLEKERLEEQARILEEENRHAEEVAAQLANQQNTYMQTATEPNNTETIQTIEVISQNNSKKMLYMGVGILACIIVGFSVFGGSSSKSNDKPNRNDREIQELKSQLNETKRTVASQQRVIEEQAKSIKANSYNSYSSSRSSSSQNYSNSSTTNNSSSTQNYSKSNQTRYGFITGNDVIIRSSATTNSNVVGYLNKNDRVTILERVSNSDKNSAIFSREMYLNYNGHDITLNKGLAINVQSDTGNKVTGKIKLKDGWHTVTTPRDSITYINSSAWYRVKAGNKEGYVYGDYVSER